MTNKTTCKNCDSNITLAKNGIWVDSVNDATCEEPNPTHEPAPEVMNCEDCGNEMPWDFSDKSCERCIEEYEQQMRDQNWDYYHA